jgi:pimeloyl-ACP methyl ester carboxylesterase
MNPSKQPFEVERRLPGGARLTLRGDQAGDGPPVLLLHGLSATRRYVVQGSRHLVKRGYRLIAYDARGHGDSDAPPDPAAYEYEDLVGDLAAVLDALELERAALVGSSMGAATAMAFALRHPERVPALVQITPSYTGTRTTEIELDVWNRLADALAEGVERFVAVAVPDDFPERWREISAEATRQRMRRHRRLATVADAVRVIPRSTAFDGLEPLRTLEVPTLIVGSRDEADTIHPYAVAEQYLERLPQSELVVEAEDESPLAWRGAALSHVVADFLGRAGYS